MAEETQTAEMTNDPVSTDGPQGHGRTELGLVVSNKMAKTIVVVVQRQAKHPVYKKYIRRDKKLYVHDEGNVAGEGDRVEVREISRPLSKLKRYTLSRIVERAK